MRKDGLKKIELNKKYKYGELCKIFEEDKKTGNSKISQMKDWERHMAITKGDKATFIITEIYDTPKEKIDYRINNGHHENSRGHNIVYGKLLDEILISYIKTQKDKSYLTTNEMAIYSNMINENYRLSTSNRVAFNNYLKSKLNVFNDSALRNTLYSIRGIIKPAIDSSLKRLSKKGYIKMKYGYIVQMDIEKVDTIQLLQNSNYRDVVRLATIQEEKVIKSLEKMLLEGFGASGLNELSQDNLKRFFYQLNEKIKEVYPMFDIVYKGYEIIKLNLLENVKINDTDIKNYKKELKNIVLNRLKEKPYKDVEKIQYKIQERLSNENYFGCQPRRTLKKYESDIISDNYTEDCITIQNILVGESHKKLSINDIMSSK